jgi:hypothetical protein
MPAPHVTTTGSLRSKLVLVSLAIAVMPARAWGDPPPAPVGESLFAPRLPRGTTRVAGDLRPFFNLLGPGWGGINDFTIEHYFVGAPFKVSAVVAPLAFASGAEGTGMITHARLGGGLATDFIELEASLGGRYQRFGPGGFSAAGGLRLGALDGLMCRFDLTYAIVRNYYTGRVVVAASSLLTRVEVPVNRAVALVFDGGFSFDAWFFGTVGLKHHLGPRGAPGTWTVSGGLGIAWVLDRFPCQYNDPRPCENAAWATGPTLTLGLDRRF